MVELTKYQIRDTIIAVRSRQMVLTTVLYFIQYMYGHTYSKSMDQPCKVANPARGRLNRENEYFLVRVRA